MADHIQSDPYAISPVEIYAYTLIKNMIGKRYASIHDWHSVLTHRMCLFNVWVFMELPTDQVTWMLDAFPSKTLWRNERLLLSILHWYSLTFRCKCTSDTPGELLFSQGKPQRVERYQETVCNRAPSSVEGLEARSYSQGSMEGWFSSPLFTLQETWLPICNH